MNMSELLNKIHEYLKTNYNYEDEELIHMDNMSVLLAKEIAIYAHRNQTRVNGENYFKHPYSVLNIYREFIGIVEDDPFCIDVDLLDQCEIPFYGVQEVCLLHDVIEDSDLNEKDIRNIFEECGFENHYLTNIQNPLLLITHDKSVSYQDYITIVLEHPTSALVKMCDLYDNSNPLSLNIFSDKEYERGKRYLSELYRINKEYNFIENCKKYKDEFKKSSIEICGYH